MSDADAYPTGEPQPHLRGVQELGRQRQEACCNSNIARLLHTQGAAQFRLLESRQSTMKQGLIGRTICSPGTVTELLSQARRSAKGLGSGTAGSQNNFRRTQGTDRARG